MDKKFKTHNPKSDYTEADQKPEFKDFSPDQIGLRVIELDGEKVKYNIIQENPWQLWRIQPSRGPVPDDLVGTFTSEEIAKQAIMQYINKRNGVKLGA